MPQEHIVSCIEEERARHRFGVQRLEKQLHELIDKAAHEHLSPAVHIPEGSPKTVIPQVAKELEADLVVMGTVARTGVPGLLIGNTAETILDQLSCSILAVKPKGFSTPVAL